MATKLDAISESGVVLIAHHDSEALAITRADESGLPYVLTRWMPRDVVYQLDCDALYANHPNASYAWAWERTP